MAIERTQHPSKTLLLIESICLNMLENNLGTLGAYLLWHQGPSSCRSVGMAVSQSVARSVSQPTIQPVSQSASQLSTSCILPWYHTTCYNTCYMYHTTASITNHVADTSLLRTVAVNRLPYPKNVLHESDPPHLATHRSKRYARHLLRPLHAQVLYERPYHATPYHP